MYFYEEDIQTEISENVYVWEGRHTFEKYYPSLNYILVFYLEI